MLTNGQTPCCPDCFAITGQCLNPQCRCHRVAAAGPDLVALAVQQEEARAIGPGAFGIARCAFLAGIHEELVRVQRRAS
jgi:hypothetical protein